ncbi:unnamed protein product [Rhizophagus irregularis]|nr:unnamed protein product [Rhizophagus irregularis]CAB5380770.1 unnamed protein product [Rhizophagus irregularis]
MINSKFIENLSTTLRAESANLKKVTTDYEVMCNEYDKLKIHLENENFKNKNKQNNHSLLYNEITNLKIQNKEYKKTLSTLRSEKEVLTNQLAELVVENKKLTVKIRHLLHLLKVQTINYSAILNKMIDSKLKQFEDKLKEQSKYDRLATDIKVRMEKSVNFKKDLTN